MMTRRQAGRALLAGTALLVVPGLSSGQDLQLPPPVTDGGKPLMQALRARRSIREYAPRPLPLPVLSGLLWAAFGINRPASGDRTAPSWRHLIAIDIYVALSEGYAFTDTGFFGQNVHLFCASEGLATVFRGSVDREKLARTMRLDTSQFITFAQSVGYPTG